LGDFVHQLGVHFTKITCDLHCCRNIQISSTKFQIYNAMQTKFPLALLYEEYPFHLINL
jgi:hypothetical protein